jgi:hypothetical protein
MRLAAPFVLLVVGFSFGRFVFYGWLVDGSSSLSVWLLVGLNPTTDGQTPAGHSLRGAARGSP